MSGWVQNPYVDGEVHPTVRCPECGSKMFYLVPATKRPFWSCDQHGACRGTRPCKKDILGWTANPGDYDPYDGAGLLTVQQRGDIYELVGRLVQDGLTTKPEAWTGMYVAVGGKVRHYRNWTVEQADAALAWLRAERTRLETAKVQVVAPAPALVEDDACDEVVRDAYGSMTICLARRRWCLGVAPHATRATHTEDNRHVVWDEVPNNPESGDLREEAEAAFYAADSRRGR